MSRLLLLAIAIAAMRSAAPPALAGGLAVSDPRGDARGSTVLDLASVDQGLRNELLTHSVTTYNPWKTALLANGGEMSLYFDTNADGEIDRQLEVRHAGGGLSAVMTDRSGRLVGGGLATQTDSRTVVVEFARSLLRQAIHSYRWFAFTGFRCHHRYKVCGDTTPGRGRWISHQLGNGSPQPDPAPVSGLGYKLVYDEQFADLSGWTPRIWYDPAPPAGAVSVSNGNLILKARKSDGWKNVTATTLGHRSFRQGYFEARMRWTRGNGAWPGFWLFSTTHAKNPNWPNPACARPTCLSGELDVFEGQGSEPNVFYGTLHRNSCQCYGAGDQQNSNNYHPTGSDLSAGWHVYSALWTETEVVWYLDGRKLMQWPIYDSTDQAMFVLFSTWLGGWTVGVDSTTPGQLVTEVDWLRVWQKP